MNKATLPNRLALWILILLAMGWILPTAILAQSAPNNPPITNRDVIDLVAEGFSPDVIKAKIVASTCQFDISIEALKSLKKSNVPQDVILAMVNTHPSTASPKSSSKLRTVECVKGDTQAILWVAPGKMEEVARIRCNDKVTILAEEAERPQEIDVARAQEAKSRAEALLKSNDPKVDYARAEDALQRAEARLSVAKEK